MASPRHTTMRAASRAALLPKGARIPQPNLLIFLARTLVFSVLVLFFASPTLRIWAQTHRIPESSSGLLPHEALMDGTSLFAALIIALLSPSVVFLLGGIGVVSASLMLAEVLLGGISVRLQHQRTPHMPITYLRVRAPQPAGGRTAGGATPSGDQFFRAIQQALPVGTWRERISGDAPWVSCTLTGLPDLPITLGVVVADRHATRRAETVRAIRAIIQGQLVGAQIDADPDPLRGVLTPGRTVVWRDYGLKLPAAYPLRFLDDISGSDLLGPLLAALAPRGVVATESQISVRPAQRGMLHTGWRGQATALLLHLHAKHEYALTADAHAIEAKLDAAPFLATLRIVVVAEGADADAGITLTLHQIAEVMGQYHQRTSHHVQMLVPIDGGAITICADTPPIAFQSRAPRSMLPPALLLPLQPWRAPDLLSAIELAGLWHLPTPTLGNLVSWLPCVVLPPPPHAIIAPGRSDRIAVGAITRADGTAVFVGPTLRDLRPPLHLTAGMGAGKSRVLANICQQCIPHGMVLLDGKGDDQEGSLVATVRTLIPVEDEHRLILFDILDTDWPIGLNPVAGIELTKPGAQDQALGQIMAIFARLDPATWGRAPAMKEFVQMATLLVLDGEAQPTLAHIKQCLLDTHYRDRLLPHCTNPDVLIFWTVTFPTQGDQQRSSLHALLRRFSQLLTTETTRYLVSQPSVRLDLRAAIAEQQIVLVPLPHVTLGDLASAVGMLVLQQVVRAAFSRPGNDQTRVTYPLIIDELQVFISSEGESTDLQHAITQLRGLGIAGIYAHQTLDQLGALKDDLLTNSGSRLILRTQEPDASMYARMYAASGISATDIAGQDANTHQYAVLQCDGERTGLFSMRVLPWPTSVPPIREPFAGPPWHERIPPDSPDPACDAALLRLIYQPHAQPAAIVQMLADYDDDDWQWTLARWEAIRHTHRQYILDTPGCIALDESITDPDPAVQATKRAARQRLDRQMWLSRLLVATPRLLAAAEYARIRRTIASPESTRPTRRATTGERLSLRRDLPSSALDIDTAPSATCTGFVEGTAAATGERPWPLRSSDYKTVPQVMQERGRRRRLDDIAPGYDDEEPWGDPAPIDKGTP